MRDFILTKGCFVSDGVSGILQHYGAVRICPDYQGFTRSEGVKSNQALAAMQLMPDSKL